MTAADTELARRLRHLRRKFSESETVICERGGVGRGVFYNALHAGKPHPPPWETVKRVIAVLGGSPDDLEEAWKAARDGAFLTRRDLILVDLDIMRGDLAAYMEELRPEMIASAVMPDLPVDEYEFGIDSLGRVTCWHIAPGCGHTFHLLDGSEFLAGVTGPQRGAPGDG